MQLRGHVVGSVQVRRVRLRQNAFGMQLTSKCGVGGAGSVWRTLCLKTLWMQLTTAWRQGAVLRARASVGRGCGCPAADDHLGHR